MQQIRLAAPDDFRTILNLINEASDWLRAKNTDQWSEPWPSKSARDARVRRGLAARRTWLVEDHTAGNGVTPVATITYRPDGNRNLWLRAELGVPACYVSRLIVSREYAGQQVGSALVDWAAARTRREYGAQFVRIDVWTTNNSLHSHYEKRGFYFIRFCDDVDYPSAALFQKPLAEVDATCESMFRETLITGRAGDAGSGRV